MRKHCSLGFSRLCLFDFGCVNKLFFEHVFSGFVLCSHLLLSSCNRCIHTLGSPCTPLHSADSIQLLTLSHSVQTHRETVPLTVNNVFTRDNYLHVHKGKTQTYTHTHWQKHTRTPTHLLLVLLYSPLC